MSSRNFKGAMAELTYFRAVVAAAAEAEVVVEVEAETTELTTESASTRS